jgi:hypothetical protein
MVKARSLMRGGTWGGLLFLLALSGCRIFEVPELPCGTEYSDPCPVDSGDGGRDGGGTGTDGGGTDGGGGTGTDGGGGGGTDGGGTGADGGGGGGGGTDGGGGGTDGGGTGTDAGTGTVPDAGSGTVPDAGSGTIPDAGSGTVPDAGSGTIPDAGSGTVPDAGSGTVPDAGSGPITDAGSPIPDSGIDSTEFDAGDPLGDGDDGGSGVPDAGTDMDAGDDGGAVGRLDGGLKSTGNDGGPIVVEELSIGDCSDGLCLRHKYTLSPANDGFNGLWIFDPYDVYLAHTEGSQVVRFSDGFTQATTPMGSRPYQLQGTTPDNLWAINPPETEPSSRTPVSHFDGRSWATIPVPNTGPSIRPPALFTGPEATWVAGSHGGALRWDGATWLAEHPSGTARGTIEAFWSNTSEPLFAVGAVRGTEPSTELGAYWQRLPTGTWTGPIPLSTPGMPVPALRAISGPSTDHLYAVGGKAMLRWTGTTWAPEPLPATLPEGCQLSEAQDVWVKWDGSDVWVTFDTACVLRKQDGKWAARKLPVLPTFQARQVEGFNEADGKSVDLWITGYQPEGLTPGAAAYHFTLTAQ